jgi:hypothetical protein
MLVTSAKKAEGTAVVVVVMMMMTTCYSFITFWLESSCIITDNVVLKIFGAIFCIRILHEHLKKLRISSYKIYRIISVEYVRILFESQPGNRLS